MSTLQPSQPITQSPKQNVESKPSNSSSVPHKNDMAEEAPWKSKGNSIDEEDKSDIQQPQSKLHSSRAYAIYIVKKQELKTGYSNTRKSMRKKEESS